MVERNIFLFVNPLLATLIALTFLGLWAYRRRSAYIACFAAAFFAYAIAVLVQLLGWPPGIGPNSIVSTIVYSLCILSLIEGLHLRLGRAGHQRLIFAIAVAVVLCAYYFYYVTDWVSMRAYTQNFGYGAMVLLCSLTLRPLRRGAVVDRVLFWIVVIFGIQFFVRTFLTLDVREQFGPEHRFAMSRFWIYLNFVLIIFGFALALALLAAVASDILQEARRAGHLDSVTGLYNRRAFEAKARAALASPAAHPVSLIFCDVDHFKSINDRFGHRVGDEVLRGLAGLLERDLAGRGVVARIGGEEFAVLLRHANRYGAQRVAEHARLAILAARFAGLPAQEHISASFGIAESASGEGLEHLMARADRMLYLAKAEGRNCIRVDEGDFIAGAPQLADAGPSAWGRGAPGAGPAQPKSI